MSHIPWGFLSGDNRISRQGPIVSGNILIGRALFFGFVPLVIKFPTGFFFFSFSFFIFSFWAVRSFTFSEKNVPLGRRVHKQTLLLGFLSSGPPWIRLSREFTSLIRLRAWAPGHRFLARNFSACSLDYLKTVLLGRKYGSEARLLAPYPSSCLSC